MARQGQLHEIKPQGVQAMQQPDVHFCLVSKQQVANIIPLLHEPFQPKEVVLLVSRGMLDKEPHARRTMQNLGLKVKSREIDSYNLQSIRQQVIDALMEYEGYSVGLNVTGGTKIMALGAYEAFTATPENFVFYLDTDNQRILRLTSDFAEFPLPELLDVRTTLRSYGFSVEVSPESRVFALDRLTGQLASHASYYGQAMSRLNFLADSEQARKDLSVQFTSRFLRDHRLMELVDLFRQHRILDHDGRGTLIFPDESSLQYVRGGWLEEHVGRVVEALQDKNLVLDRRMNIALKSPSGADNELDVAFTAKNRLHLIECKTVNYQSSQGYARADQAAYKLHSLRQETAGAFGRAMIVSFRRLRSSDRQRCRDLDIDIVEAGELANLQARLRSWIGL
jgi:hypothetical protein